MPPIKVNKQTQVDEKALLNPDNLKQDLKLKRLEESMAKLQVQIYSQQNKIKPYKHNKNNIYLKNDLPSLKQKV